MNGIVYDFLQLDRQRWCNTTDVEFVEAFPVFDCTIRLCNDGGHEGLEVRKVCRDATGPCRRIAKRVDHLRIIALVGGNPGIERRPVINAGGGIEIRPIQISDLPIAGRPYIPTAYDTDRYRWKRLNRSA